MRAVLTRVTEAAVTVDGKVVGAIDCPETGGILALVGVGREDSDAAWETMARKIAEPVSYTHLTLPTIYSV